MQPMTTTAEAKRLADEDYCANHCAEERRDWEDCALNGGCPLAKKGQDPFTHMSDMLSEMQAELILRQWKGDTSDRITRAANFRLRLYDAIVAYRKSYTEWGK